MSNKCGEVYKLGWEDDSYWIQYAYDLSKCDKNFVWMLESENGMWDSKRQSEYYYENGIREKSWGFCQINCPSHKELCGSYNKPTWDGFYNQEWQMKTCYDLFIGGTKFYGFLDKIRLNKAKKNIIFL